MDARWSPLLAVLVLLALPSVALAERAWLPPERLTPPGTAGQDFHVAVGLEGGVVAAWVERGSGKLELYATVRGPAGASAGRVLVDGDTHGSVSMAANELGDAIIAWQSASTESIMVARRRPGQLAFGEPQVLAGSRSRTSSRMHIALDVLGNAVIVHAGGQWDESNERPFEAVAWYAPASGTFGAPRVVAGTHEIRTGGVGDVVLLPTQEAVAIFGDTWYGADDARVRAATWQATVPDSTVDVTTLAALGDRSPRVMQLEADALGRVTALWSDNGGGSGRMHVQHRVPGGAFGPAFPIEAPLEFAPPPWQPLDLSAAGDLLTAWAPGAYDDAGTVVTGGFGAAPTGAQAVPGHPRAVAGGGGAEGDLLVVGHTAPGWYAQRLVTARRAPGSPGFTRLRDAAADCLVLTNWVRAAVGLDGTGAILSQDPDQGLWLLVDAPATERPARGCHGADAYDPLAEDAVAPPVDPPVTLPKPPVVVKPPVRRAGPPEPVLERVRVKRSGGAEVVTFSVRCASCTARASGRLLARRSVLARAKTTSRARRGAARVTLRFRPTRRARAAARGPRRFAIDVRLSAPGSPATVRRLSVPAR